MKTSGQCLLEQIKKLQIYLNSFEREKIHLYCLERTDEVSSIYVEINTNIRLTRIRRQPWVDNINDVGGAQIQCANYKVKWWEWCCEVQAPYKYIN